MYLCRLKLIGMTGQKTPTALGTEKIGKLLMQYAIPAIIAMTASSLYNMVDSIFIGHGVGAMAISGLALTFPLMNLAAAFGSLVGVGAATLISVKLGQKDYDTAQRVLGNVFVLNLIIGISFTLVVLPFLDPILYFFGGSDETVKYAREFMQVILLGNVVTHLYLGLNAVLRASGHPQKAMMATITTVIINVLLAPLFIFVFDWGIRGAATATVCAQLIALVWQLHLFCRKDELIRLKKGIFRLKRKIVLDSLAIGMSPFLMNMASCFIVILINQGLKEHGGDLAIGAFGIVNELISIASKGFRIVVFFYPIVGFQMVASNFFQSIGMASKAIFLSLTRQMLFLVPCLLILPHYYGQMGVWASMPVADLAASLISGGMLWWQFRQFKKVTV